MRPFFAGLLALTVASAPLALRADDSTAVKELLDKAMKAQGGTEKAAKIADLSLKGKGQVNEGGQNAELSFELSMKDFDRLRMELTMVAGGMTNKATLVMVGDKGWARDSIRDKLEDAPKEVIPIMKSFLLAIRAPGSPALLGGRKDLTLAHGGESKVDDATAEVLRISRKDQPDITVYIDKKTGLPLKSEAQIKEPGENEEKAFTFVFADFKETDGLKHFTRVKIIREGKELVELELSDIKAGAKFEPNTFEKP